MRREIRKIGFLMVIFIFMFTMVQFKIVNAEDFAGSRDIGDSGSQISLQKIESDPQEVIKGIKSPQKVMLNGRDVEVSAYKINDENYFRLRDIAALLTDTNKAFDVIYDEKRNMVQITRNKKYQKIEGDLSPLAEGEITGIRSPQVMEIDGIKQDIKAYKIFWNNYYRLRDLGERLDFEVDFHRSTQKVIINSELMIPKPVPKGEIKVISYKGDEGETLYKHIYPDEIMNEPMRLTYPRAPKGQIVYDILERGYFNDQGEPVNENGVKIENTYRERMAHLFKVKPFELDLRHLETIGLGGTGGDWNTN